VCVCVFWCLDEMRSSYSIWLTVFARFINKLTAVDVLGFKLGNIRFLLLCIDFSCICPEMRRMLKCFVFEQRRMYRQKSRNQKFVNTQCLNYHLVCYLFTSFSSQFMSDDSRLELFEEKRDEMGRENPIKFLNCEVPIDLRASDNPWDALRKRDQNEKELKN